MLEGEHIQWKADCAFPTLMKIRLTHKLFDSQDILKLIEELMAVRQRMIGE